MTLPVITFSSPASGQLKVSWSDNGADSWIISANGQSVIVNATGAQTYEGVLSTNISYNSDISVGFWSLFGDGQTERDTIPTKINRVNSLTVALTAPTIRTLSWAALSGATGYKIERSDDNRATWQTLAEEATGTSYVDSHASVNVSQYYRITPVTESGCRSPVESTVVAYYVPLSLSAMVSGRTVILTVIRPADTTGIIRIQRSYNGGAWIQFSNFGTAATAVSFGEITGYTVQYRAYQTDVAGSVYSDPITIPYSMTVWLCKAVMNSKIFLAWPPITGATSYKVERSTNQNDWTEITSVENLAIESADEDYFYFYDETPVVGTFYYYRVSCVDANDAPYLSDNVSATVIGEVAALTAVRYSTNRITLSWTSAPGAANYTLETSLDGGTTWNSVATSASAVSYTLNVTLNTRYMARVKSNGGGGSWAITGPFWQPSASALTPAIALNEDGYPVITWTELDCAEQYVIERRKSGVGSFVALGTPSESPYTDSTVERLTAYQYRVGMYDSVTDAYLYYSSFLSITSGDLPVAPESPTLETIEGIHAPFVIGETIGTLAAIDENDPEVLTFLLVAGVGDDDNSKFIISGTQLLAAENLPAGDYSIRVRVTDSAGLTAEAVFAFSLELVPLDAPANLAAPADYHSLAVVFDAVTGAASYRLEWQVSGSASWSEANLASAPTELSPHVISGLATGTVYSLRVKAIASVGENLDSVWANETATTTADNEAPVITLSSSDDIRVAIDGVTTLPSATALDAVDGACAVTCTIFSPSGDSSPDTPVVEIDTSVSGTYYVLFSANDLSGNTSTERVNIIVGLENLFAPNDLILSSDYHALSVVFGAVTGAASYRLEWQVTGAASWNEANLASAPSAQSPHVITGLTTGTEYVVRVKAIGDGVENLDSVWATESATTTADTAGPVIALSLNGASFTAASIETNTGETLEIPAATAFDAVDGECDVEVVITNDSDDSVVEEIDTSVVGDYTVTYSASDLSGNETMRSVAVSVADPVPPVITLNDYGETGQTTAVLEIGGTYIEYGATAIDNTDGALTPVITGSVDTSRAGIYRVTYTAADASGNIASAERVVIVGFIPMEAAAETQRSIHIRWGSLGSMAVDVQRRNISSDQWTTVATGVVSDTAGAYYEDTDVVSEQRYYYRLLYRGTAISEENLAWTLTIKHYSVVTSAASGGETGTGGTSGEQAHATAAWSIITDISRPFTHIKKATFMTTELKRDEAGVFTARVFDTNTCICLQESEIESIQYTAYRSSYATSSKSRVPITGHTNIAVAVSDVWLEEPIVDEYWSADEIGYNFIHQPDIRNAPMFTDVGHYEIVYRILPMVGNPIILTFDDIRVN